MGAQVSGLTLQGLAHRLEALERENEQMRSENAELGHKAATLEGSGTGRGVEATKGHLPLGAQRGYGEGLAGEPLG